MPKKKNTLKGSISKKRFNAAFKDLKVENLARQVDQNDINTYHLQDTILITTPEENGTMSNGQTRYDRRICFDFDHASEFNMNDAKNLSFYLYTSFSEEPENITINFLAPFDIETSIVPNNPSYIHVKVNFPDDLDSAALLGHLYDGLAQITINPRTIPSAPDQITVDIGGTVDYNSIRRNQIANPVLTCTHDEIHVFEASLYLEGAVRVFLGDKLHGTRSCFWTEGARSVVDDSLILKQEFKRNVTIVKNIKEDVEQKIIRKNSKS